MRMQRRTAGIVVLLVAGAAAAGAEEPAPSPPAARVEPAADPNYSRLLFAPSGRPLKKGDGYFSDYELVFPGISYGITDNVMVSGGMSTIPGLGLAEQVFYVSPQVGFELGKSAALSAGFLYGRVASGVEGALGIAYGVATLGSPRRSVTVGFGLGGDLDGEGLRSPILLLGGQLAVGRRVSLLAESWLLVDEADLGSQPLGFGVRLHNGRLSADLGFVLVPELLDEGLPLPWVSVSYHFGPSRPPAEEARVNTRASGRTLGTR
jgi:hypothetical protein